MLCKLKLKHYKKYKCFSCVICTLNYPFMTMTMMSCFVVWLNDERRLSLFSAGIIVRGAHNRESLTRHETCVWGCAIVLITAALCHLVLVCGKTPFFVIGQFYTPHSVCLNIGFWHGFVWKYIVFNHNASTNKKVL